MKEIIDLKVDEEDKVCYPIRDNTNKVDEFTKLVLDSADLVLENVKHKLCALPSFIESIKAAVPKEVYQLVFTEEQQKLIDSGAVELMRKKDGGLMATLRNIKENSGKTGINSNVNVESVKLTPELTQMLVTHTMQMQLANITQNIELMQRDLETIQQGQENDRLAIVFSCKQRFFQIKCMKDENLKKIALLSLINDAENSRNQLMLSQEIHLRYIQELPESALGKLVSKGSVSKIEDKMKLIKDNFYAVNLVSMIEALAYQECGEFESSQISLNYYGEYLKKQYIDKDGFLQRLDGLGTLPNISWVKMLPKIQEEIEVYQLGEYKPFQLIRGEVDGTESM